MGLIDWLRLLRPLKKVERKNLSAVFRYLDAKHQKELTKLLKQKNIGVTFKSVNASPELMPEQALPMINPASEDKALHKKTGKWNEDLEYGFYEKAFKEFSHNAGSKFKKYIAPHILGLDEVKDACALQLFCTERAHILIIGDPGTGKTDIIRSTSEIAPVSSFGLGSGTSSVGLTGSMKGKEFTEGLLPMADEGICAIDELNMMKPSDMASLYNAMEKGFVTYDKGSTHKKLDANVRVLATANPKGDRFVGKTADILKKQLPFDPALMSRFHLTFLVRKPDREQFLEISKKIIVSDQTKLRSEDKKFLTKYVNYAEKTNVAFDKKLQDLIIDFIEEISKDESKFLVEIGPRTIIGIVRLSKASARMHLRREVEESDVIKAIDVVRKSLYIKR